jgi:hypothetical protein
MLSSVDLPLPEGPTTDTNSPFLTEKLMCLKATSRSAFETNTFETLRTSREI